MAKMNFGKARNPVNENYPCEPEYKGDKLEKIIFHLRPLDTGIQLAVYTWVNSMPQDRPAIMVEIASLRIKGWEGLQDENGNEVPFSDKNKAYFMGLYEAMPYLMDVAQHTIDEVLDESEKKPTSMTKSETSNND
jgi:hypothetical protein